MLLSINTVLLVAGLTKVRRLRRPGFLPNQTQMFLGWSPKDRLNINLITVLLKIFHTIQRKIIDLPTSNPNWRYFGKVGGIKSKRLNKAIN
jgi:hypothetical protein